MKALITGASSGLGAELARQLAALGYDIIAVARRSDRLEALARELSVSVTPISCDLSSRDACTELYERLKNEDIEIVINNAGFGTLGEFSDTALSRDLDMIDLNVCAPHILTKLFLGKFKAENRGYILNVASVGAYFCGPLLAPYYASKSYLKSLTLAINEELRHSESRVYVGCVCPGPIDTEFSEKALAKNSIRSRSAEAVAKSTVRGMLRRRTVIVPGLDTRLSILASRLLPEKLFARITYGVQKKKLK